MKISLYVRDIHFEYLLIFYYIQNIINFMNFGCISGCFAAKGDMFLVDTTIPKITILGIVIAANTEKTAYSAFGVLGCLS